MGLRQEGKVMETYNMVFKVYLGVGDGKAMVVIHKVLKDHGLDATIYFADGVFNSEVESSIVIELVFMKVTHPFNVSANVHTFANTLKFELKPDSILVTRADLGDAQLI